MCLPSRGLIGKEAGEMDGPSPKFQPSRCTCQHWEWKSLLASPVLVGFCSTRVSRSTRSCSRKGSQGWGFHFNSSNPASCKKWGKLANIIVMGMRNVPELREQQVGAALSSKETRKAFYWDCGSCLSQLSAVSQDMVRAAIPSTPPSRLWSPTRTRRSSRHG